MKASLAAKLAQLERRLFDVEQILGSEEVTKDLESFRRLSREHAEVGPVVALYRNYKTSEADLFAAHEMLADPSLRDFAQDEIDAAKEKMAGLEAELQKALLPRDPNDERNTFLEIRAGTGGDESGLFAGDLLRMYLRYSERNKWQTEIVSESPGDVGGYREVRSEREAQLKPGRQGCLRRIRVLIAVRQVLPPRPIRHLLHVAL